MKYSACEGKDAVVGGKVDRNERKEVFCPPYRTGKKVPWWNWGGKSEQSVPRAQKGRAGITDLEKVAGTVDQKAKRSQKNLEGSMRSVDTNRSEEN